VEVDGAEVEGTGVEVDGAEVDGAEVEVEVHGAETEGAVDAANGFVGNTKLDIAADFDNAEVEFCEVVIGPVDTVDAAGSENIEAENNVAALDDTGLVAWNWKHKELPTLTSPKLFLPSNLSLYQSRHIPLQNLCNKQLRAVGR
jgi:hypothetical protein